MEATKTSTSNAVRSESFEPDGRTKGCLFVCIGIVLICTPLVSLASSSLSLLASNDENASADNREGHTTSPLSLLNVFYDQYWKENHPYWRILTFLPAVLVICICHWVSLRIYLRR